MILASMRYTNQLRMTKAKAYSYLRFSTPEQFKGDSFRRQTDMAEVYAKQHDLELQELTFRDLGVSGFKGKNLKTGALGRFKQEVENGAIQSDSWLLIEAWDRFSRMPTEYALPEMLSLIEMGITIVTLKGGGKVHRKGSLDMTTLLTCVIEMSQANEFSQNLVRRISAANANKREAIRKTGSGRMNKNCPLWMKPKGDDGFELIEDRAEVVRKIFELTIDGHGRQAVRNYLVQNRIKPFNPKSRTWHTSYIERILKNHQAYGAVQLYKNREPDGEPLRGYYPAAVSEDMYLAALHATRQRKIADAKGVTRRNRVNVFSGLLWCECGDMIRLKNNGKGQFYYKCINVLEHRGCKARTLKQKPTDEMLIQALYLFGDKLVVGQGGKKDDKTSETIHKVKGELERTEAKRDVAMNRLLEFDSDALSAAFRTLDNKVESLQSQLSDLEQEAALARNRVNTKELGVLLSELENTLSGSCIESKVKIASALAELIERIEFGKGLVRIKLRTNLPDYFGDMTERDMLFISIDTSGKLWSTEGLCAETDESIYSQRKVEGSRIPELAW